MRSALVLAALLGACTPSLPPEILPTEPEDVRVVRGRALVLDGEGRLHPLPGIRLSAFFWPGTWDFETDDEGRFTLDGVPFVDFVIETRQEGIEFAVNTGGWCTSIPVDPADRNVDLVFFESSLTERVLGSQAPPGAWSPPPPGRGFALAGRVLDEEGNPLAGAEVRAEGTDRRARTDGNGVFRLTGLRQVRHDLRVRFEGEAFPIAIDASGGVEIRALPGSTISGTVRDPSGRPLAGVRVVAEKDPPPPRPEQGEDAGDLAWDRTDHRGRFRIGGLSPGAHAVRVSDGGLRWCEGEARRGVPAGTTDLVLTAAPTWFESSMVLYGRVLARGGRPAEGVAVTASPEAFRGPVRTVVCTEDGRFRIAGLSAGPHRVAADRPGPENEVRGVLPWTSGIALVVD